MYTKIIFATINTNIGIHIGGTTINNLRYDDGAVLHAEKRGISARNIELSKLQWENV